MACMSLNVGAASGLKFVSNWQNHSVKLFSPKEQGCSNFSSSNLGCFNLRVRRSSCRGFDTYKSFAIFNSLQVDNGNPKERVVVLVIGGGGREHALCHALRRSPSCDAIFCAPGNAGISSSGDATCISDLDVLDGAAVIAFCRKWGVGLVVVGPEAPLVAGLANDLVKEGIPTFGPSSEAAALEGSKNFMKSLCDKYGIPTAKYQAFTNPSAAKEYIKQEGAPIVVKADGLAAGKGVIVAMTLEQAYEAVDSMLVDNVFGSAGTRVVVEEYLEGEEASFFALVPCRFLKGLDTSMYDVVCIAPRNHMVFTPLLASTCVGTLEFRSVAEPVTQIQKALAKEPNSHFFLASCTGLDTDKHEVYCEVVGDRGVYDKPHRFKVAYDKLVIASGAEPLTFGIKGVQEHAFFLREVQNAQEIRKRLLMNLMISETPGISEEEKERLLHCVVIGGGPTGVEFSGELSDFIMRDVRERYAHVKNYIHVTLIEANEILSSFDVGLREYATKHLTKVGVRLVQGVVKEVHPDKIVLSDGSDVPYGLLVWSTGVGPSKFVKSLDIPKSPGGRIGIDEWLRVPSVEDVFAIGDCAGFLEQTGKPVLPALAQVAERQGKYLVKLFTNIGKQNGGKALSAKDITLGDPFVYRHLGSMATVGRYKALVDLRQSKGEKGISIAGFTSWFIWRSAYLTRVISWRNRFYVAMNWGTTLIFGRDNTKIG